jgi:hypothetical protein
MPRPCLLIFAGGSQGKSQLWRPLSPMNNRIISIAALTLLVATTATQARASDASPWRMVRGTFELVTFPCSAPAGLRGSVDWHGSLEGESSFSATAQIRTNDTPATSVVLVTGDNLLSLRGGTISTKDAVVFRLTGNGDFAEVDTIVAGTGDYAGASGAWRAGSIRLRDSRIRRDLSAPE